MSRVVVTGGAGAIGSHLVGRLVARGDDVVVVDDLSSGSADLVHPEATLIVGSIVDEEVVARAFERPPRLVAHLAARFANQNSVDHPVDDLLVNGLGTLRVLEAARSSRVDKVLVTSSSCVYDGPELVESAEARSHQTPYAITKSLSEEYARFYADHHGLDVVIVRPFNSYGPHELPGRYRNVIPNFMALALAGEPLPITGDGHETRDFTYVDDIVEGMLLALAAASQPGEAFNLAGGGALEILELAERINNLSGNEAGVTFVPRRNWDRTRHRRASTGRARAGLGFEAKVSLDEGLARTFDWLRNRLA